MRYFSTFSGIGGFEVGIQRASDKQFTKVEQDWQRGNGNINQMGHDVLPASRFSPLCVGYSEIDKYAIKVYQKQFGGHKNYGDITKINAEEIPDFDCLVGGFPCQAFSIAGKRKGFDDTRGTLFFDIARILENKRPRHLVLENVKGLLSHDGGKTFQTILGVLSDLGYRVEWQILNSKNFGVPQNRERIFIIGHLRGECGRKILPITGNGKENSWQGKPVFSTVRATYPRNWNGDYIDTDTEYRQKEERFESARIRRLTPKECERLQGFPDNWTALGVNDEPISDTQRYKMCGNAVTTNVIQAIFERVLV